MSLNTTFKLIKLLVNKEMDFEEAYSTLHHLFEDPRIILTFFNLILDEDDKALKHYLESTEINHIISSPSFKENLYIRALEKDRSALSFIEEFPNNSNFCLKAAQYNGLALEYVPKTVDNYFNIALTAVEKNPESVQYIPRSLPPHLKKQLYLAAVNKDGLVLEYIFDGQSDPDVCQAAIEENIFAIEFVDEDLRSQLLTNRKQHYLTRNYMVRIYFIEVDQQLVNNFLKKIEYVIAFNKSDIYDRELQDVMQVYSHAPSRHGKVTCVSTTDFKKLMTDLTEAGSSKIKLIILGHANTGVERIAGWDCETISKIIQDYTFINQVTLFGCKSAQANKLEEEKEIIRRVSAEKTTNLEEPCALMIVRAEGLKSPEKLLKTSTLPAVFVIVQHQEGNEFSYSLKYISKKDDQVSSEDIPFLTSDEVSRLANNFNKKRDLNTAFAKKLNICSLRNNKNPLKFEEIELLNAFFSKDIFSKNSPLYKQIKQDYPFMRGINITETEAIHKLSKSLLRKLVEAIKSNSAITREIIVKGYSNILHVDKEQLVFHVLPNLSYTRNYYKNRLFTDPNCDNIDRKNLSIARKKMIEEIEKGEEEGETLSKSIKVVINSKSP